MRGLRDRSVLRPASATLPFPSQERFPCVLLMAAPHAPPARLGPSFLGVGAAVGHRRPDRQPAGPRGGPVRRCRWPPAGSPSGGVLIVVLLAVTGRRPPAGRAAWTRIAVIGAAGRAVPELLLHRRRADLGGPGHPGHHRHRPGDRARRGPGLRAPDRPARAARRRPGAGRPGPAGRPAVRLRRDRAAASAGLAVLAAAGFAAVTLIGARPVPGLDELTVTGFGFTLGGLVLMPAAAALGGLAFRPGPAGRRAARRAGRRPDRGRLHAVFPRPADRRGQHRARCWPCSSR